MLKNYLQTAFRVLSRNKLFTLINVAGLAIGITACLFISHYARYQLSYDKHFLNEERLYRVLYEREGETGEKVQFASASPAIGPELVSYFPEIKSYGRLYKTEGVMAHENIHFREERLFYAMPKTLELFGIHMLEDNGSHLLAEPNTVILSKTTAHKYFGNESPLGKILTLDGTSDFRVIGVYADLPENTHFRSDMFLSYITWENRLGQALERSKWFFSGFYTYVQVAPGTDIEALNEAIPELIDQKLGQMLAQYKMKMRYKLQPVTDIHLTSHFMHELAPNGNRQAVWFLFIIAWFIILIAWINFINLLTISSMKRHGEISLRKVLGGKRIQLIGQFLTESLLINSMALLLAVLLVALLMPFFRQLTNMPASAVMWQTSWFWPTLLLIFATGVLLAGSYPVWGILNKRIASSLRRSFTGTKRAVALRKALVVFQFFMATLLIVGTISVYMQLAHLKANETGIDKSSVMVVRAPIVGDSTLLQKRQAFKQELMRNPGIEAVCFSSVVPGKHNMFNRGGIRPVNSEPTDGKNYRVTETDRQFIQVYRTHLLAGRNFSEDPQARSQSVIVNLRAMDQLGYASPNEAVGQKIYFDGYVAHIVGVMENFHQESPRLAFEPQIFRPAKRHRGYFSIRTSGGHPGGLHRQVEEEYNQFFPGNPFEHSYLEEAYARQYASEAQFGEVFGVFAFLALFITLLGLISLAAFSANQRRQEIGIRKVLGATAREVLVLLSRSYIGLLALAFILALPVGYYALEEWLNNFANRMEISPWLFVAAAVVVSAMTLITVIWQSARAAKENPAHALRYE